MGYKHEVSLSLNISSFRVNLADSSHPEWSKLAKAFLLKAQGEDSPTPQLLEGGSHNLQVKKQNQNTPPHPPQKAHWTETVSSTAQNQQNGAEQSKK